MNKRPEVLRAFLLTFVGLLVGFAVIKLAHGAMVTVVAVVVAVLAFLWFRVRGRG